MGRAVDFEKIRRKRQNARRVRQIVALLIVVVLILLGVYINQMMVDSSANVRISDAVESFGGNGYPINAPGGIIKNVEPLDSYLAVLNDTNLYIYSKRGKVTQNVQQVGVNTVLQTTKKNALLYTVGGKSLSLHSTSKNTASLDLDENIICACLGENGDIAVVVSPRQYVAEVRVFNKRLNSEPYFVWSSSKHMVTNVALSPNGKMMAVSCITSDEGIIQTIVYIFHLGSEDALAEASVTGGMPLKLSFLSDQQIAVLTDREYFLMDTSGQITSTYTLPSAPLTATTFYEGNLLLQFEAKETRDQSLILLNSTGEEIANATIPTRINGIALSKRNIYLLVEKGIYTYNYAMEEQSFFEQRGILFIESTKDGLYYFTKEEINLLKGDNA